MLPPQNPNSEGDLQLDHVAIAVRSIAAARTFYETLGLPLHCEEEVPHEQVRTATLSLGATTLELLEPTAEDSTIGRFLARRGEGLHHIAIRSEDLSATLARLKEQGIRLVDDTIRLGAGGHPYFFIHPQTTGGVLIEIVGNPAQAQSEPSKGASE